MAVATDLSPNGRANEIGRLALRAFLVLLVVNALIAIAAILGAAGDAEWEIIGTTLLLTAACLTIAANAAALERSRLGTLPYIAAALSCLAFAVLIVLIWVEPESDSDLIWKPTLIALTLGLAATYASLISIPGLTGNWRFAEWTGYAVAAILGALIVGAILIEEGGPAEIYAVLCVIGATATIIVLVGAMVERRSSPSPAAVAAPASGMYCPACGSALSQPHLMPGPHQCSSCGLGFSDEITRPRTS